jgi:hypothetical protein
MSADIYYIRKAIDDGIIGSIAEVDEYTAGHLKGIQAIRQMYDARLALPVPQISRVRQSILEAVKNKLRNREYDGKSLDSIVKQNTSSLGESRLLLKEILMMSETERILSKDKQTALPEYIPTPNEIERNDYLSVFKMISESSNKPRTRDDISALVGPQLIAKCGLDRIIHTLVERSTI